MFYWQKKYCQKHTSEQILHFRRVFPQSVMKSLTKLWELQARKVKITNSVCSNSLRLIASLRESKHVSSFIKASSFIPRLRLQKCSPLSLANLAYTRKATQRQSLSTQVMESSQKLETESVPAFCEKILANPEQLKTWNEILAILEKIEQLRRHKPADKDQLLVVEDSVNRRAAEVCAAMSTSNLVECLNGLAAAS